jgi:hypothetical protein
VPAAAKPADVSHDSTAAADSGVAAYRAVYAAGDRKCLNSGLPGVDTAVA